MNIAQLMEQLAAYAADLPNGNETEVHVAVCNGDELTEATNYIKLSKISFDFSLDEVVIVSHPHLHTCPEPCESFRRLNVLLLD